MKKAAAGASPKVAKCLVASVATRTNGVNACTDGVHLRDAEWVFSAPVGMHLLTSQTLCTESALAHGAPTLIRRYPMGVPRLLRRLVDP